ncbi:hypothetical protein ACFSHQ_17525 [Gemmobacter lanyuensis]
MDWLEFGLALAAFLGSHILPSRPGLKGRWSHDWGGRATAWPMAGCPCCCWSG